MLLYPDVMRKAQAQIDEVVGRGRLPNAADRDNLPYIRAMVKEVSTLSVFILLSAHHWSYHSDIEVEGDW